MVAFFLFGVWVERRPQTRKARMPGRTVHAEVLSARSESKGEAAREPELVEGVAEILGLGFFYIGLASSRKQLT